MYAFPIYNSEEIAPTLPLADLRPTKKEGYLTKEGDIVHNWKRRW
jgi:hypothetical protein